MKPADPSRNTGLHDDRGSRRITPLEWAVLVHVGLFAIGAAWAFGGNAVWVRTPLTCWGSLGLLLTVTALGDWDAWRDGSMRPLRWAWPVLLFNALVIAATFNPSFREVTYEGEKLLINIGARPGWPSSARPESALRALWSFDAIWIACFNIALVLRQRRAIRGLLMVLVVNAVALAVFGTVQKLSQAKGLFFDAIPSPQRAFFASFVYHNHWGAYMVLILAACVGLMWHYARRWQARDCLHSPALAGITAIMLLAITVPLSTSRSCSVLAAVVLCAAFLHWIRRVLQKRRQFHESIAAPVLAGTAAVALVAGATWFVARDSISARTTDTFQQLADMRAQGTIGARAVLYADSWRMAQDKPWFGWGMASYPHVFTLFNTRESVDRLPVFYNDAHSDWLQALAEHGFVGTALLGACAVVPILGLRRRQFGGLTTRYLLLGCMLVLLYAWIEFPFGNFAVVLTWWLWFFSAIQLARLRGPEQSGPIPDAP